MGVGIKQLNASVTEITPQVSNAPESTLQEWMDPGSYHPIWITLLSSPPLLWCSLFSAIAVFIMMMTLLRSRLCSDWSMMLFTTTAVFDLLILFPFLQTSRLAPGDIPMEFVDVDRPWMLIMSYCCALLVLTSLGTSIFEVFTQLYPSLKEMRALTLFKLGVVGLQFGLPLIDVFLERERQQLSQHCNESLCRWNSERKDAVLCLLLLTWMACVLSTLFCASLRDLLHLPKYIQARKKKSCREEEEINSASRKEYLEKLAAQSAPPIVCSKRKGSEASVNRVREVAEAQLQLLSQDSPRKKIYYSAASAHISPKQIFRKSSRRISLERPGEEIDELFLRRSHSLACSKPTSPRPRISVQEKNGKEALIRQL